MIIAFEFDRIDPMFFLVLLIARSCGICDTFFYTILNLRYRVCVRAAIAENVFTLISSQMSNDDFATVRMCERCVCV